MPISTLFSMHYEMKKRRISLTMTTIIEHQTLELHHLISFRGLIDLQEIPALEKKLEQEIHLAGAKRESGMIKAVHGFLYGKYDIELLIPINKRIHDTDQYKYKETLKIVNALLGKHIGNPDEADETLLELEHYISTNQYLPTSVAYQVVKKINEAEPEKSEIDIYIGVSANIL